MNIILGKDGKLSVNESPLQGKAADLDNLAAFISNPSDGDAIVYDAAAGIWKAGASGGGGGSSGGGVTPLTVTMNIDDKLGVPVLNKTWTEINTAFVAGTPVLVGYSNSNISGIGSVICIESSASQYDVYIYVDGEAMPFSAESADGSLVYNQG